MAASSNLSHVLLCAGTVGEWAATSSSQWRERLSLVARAARSGDADWATIVPSAPGTVEQSGRIREMLVAECGGVRYADRVVVLGDDGVTVIVDCCADGRQRIVEATLRTAGGEPSSRHASDGVNEERLSAAICAPAPDEPDLVVVLGSPTKMPVSLVWELAYAEIVFFDAAWHELDAEHLEMAIDDFARRDRRFGGVDS
ncbi:MAG: undecaprenyl diphosphate synthase family protein [Acidimicrobiia bacterium]